MGPDLHFGGIKGRGLQAQSSATICTGCVCCTVHSQEERVKADRETYKSSHEISSEMDGFWVKQARSKGPSRKMGQ